MDGVTEGLGVLGIVFGIAMAWLISRTGDTFFGSAKDTDMGSINRNDEDMKSCTYCGSLNLGDNHCLRCGAPNNGC